MDGTTARSEREKVEALFEAALDLPEAKRARFVALRCRDDHRLAAAVIRLLEAHRRSDGVLDVGGPDAACGDGGPTRFGPYRVLHRLGGGGMGDVYLAVREDAFMRRVALKVVRGPAPDAASVRRFEAERQIMASLSHPNIAQLLDGGVTEDGVPFLVMEHVDGLPITALCDRERLTIVERLVLFGKVCDAVHHAHGNLVIHRDLKPSNILVTPGREPKLLDFGIAKLQRVASAAQTQPETHPDLRALTPDYASPEQMRGEPLTTASDVFSLGVLLYELLTGVHPFRGDDASPAAVIEAVCEQDPAPPSEAVTTLRAGRDLSDGKRRAALRGATVDGLNNRLRGDLDMIVLKALRKEPGRRYASAEQLASDVARHLSAEPVLACGDGRGYRLRKFLQRNRMESIAAAGALVSLLLGFSLALWQAEEAVRERDRAARALQRAEASTAFLLGLFEPDDPWDTLGDSVSARVMLERGLEDVDALGDYRELRARLSTVLARAHWNLGAYDRAAGLLRSAVSDLESRAGVDRDAEGARELAATLADLADVLKMTGAYDEALATAIRAHDLRVRRLGKRAPEVAASLIQLATIRVYLADLPGADSLARAALELRSEALGPGHPDVAEAMESLALISQRRGAVDEAERLLREVVTRRRSAEGAGSAGHATSLLRLARLLARHRGAHEEAEALYRRVLLIVGPDDPQRATTLADLADVVARRGRLAEATDLYRDAIGLRRTLFSPDHASVADLLADLGDVLARAGQLDQAEEAYEEALRIWKGRLGPEHPVVAYPLSGSARVAMRRGALDRAEVLARQALAIRRDALVPGHTLIAVSEALLGEVFAARGNVDDARELLEGAAVLLRASLGEGHREVRPVEDALARLARTQKGPGQRSGTAP